jgi:hypothetical protein
MSTSSVAKLVGRLLNVVVLLVSGGYTLVYLYRWEWNRTLIAAMFFIAAEIALTTTLLLDAMRRRAQDDRAAWAMVISTANSARSPRSFEWLQDQQRLGVFVPVLLGTGVLLSALAYVVERVAGAFAGHAVDRRTAGLIDLDLPLGGRGSVEDATTKPGARRVRVLGWTVATAVVGLLAVAGVDLLADATQSRLAKRESVSGTTLIELDVRQNRQSRPIVDLAEAAWVACRSTGPPGAELVRAQDLGERRVELEVHPALTELRRRRVFGCLQDATIDRVRIDVVGWAEP